MGNEPSESSEAGVFHDTTAAEATSASHGAATEYCGRVLRNGLTSNWHYISTGLGIYEIHDYSRPLSLGCSHTPAPTDIEIMAHCCVVNCNEKCPLGWGNCYEYMNNRPGCYFGTYYPYPTQNSDTNAFTGSLAVGSENQY